MDRLDWGRCKENHVVASLSPSRCIFVRTAAVKSPRDFDVYLAKASSRDLPHFRKNLVGERASVRTAIHQRNLKTLDITSSIQTQPKRQRELSNSTIIRSVRPFASRSLSSTSISSSECATPEPSLYAGSTSSTSSLSLPSPSSSQLDLTIIKPESFDSSHHSAFPHSSSSEPIILIDDTDDEDGADHSIGEKIWPKDFYTVDIVTAFELMKRDPYTTRESNATLAEAFVLCFGVPYKKSTYNDHHLRWQAATQSARDTALAAGRTEAGLWSLFMKNNPAKNATVKKEKHRLRKALEE